MRRFIRSGIFLSTTLYGALGCGGSPDGSATPGEDDVGHVAFAVTTVPTGVLCVQVVVNPAPGGVPGTPAIATQNFAATAGSSFSATVSLGTFTRGSVQISANAFNVTCGNIGSNAPTWVADPIITTITPGAPNPAPLNFRQNFAISATGNFAPSVVDLSTGTFTTGLLLADGTVRMVGAVANPTTLTSVAQLAVGLVHACARKTDGTVWCWGDNSFGQLGNGTTTASAAPVQAIGISGATLVAAGADVSCASTASATFCWGNNGSGALGDGTTTNRSTPALISLLPGAVQIAPGDDHSCAVTKQGGIVCWGNNGNGQLGNGGTTSSLFPASVATIRAAVSVGVGGSHSCATDPTGRAYCWGSNFGGELGVGDTTQRLTPALVGNQGYVEIALSNEVSCSRTSAGKVFCWGDNVSGAVGDGTGMPQLLPVQATQNAVRLRGPGMFSGNFCAQLSDASISCWGLNNAGQLGDGTTITRFKPVTMKL